LLSTVDLVFNSLGPIADLRIRHENFSFMMSLPAIFLGLRFCISRKGGTRGGGWVHPKGANNMAASGLVLRCDLVGTGRAISVPFELETSDVTL